MWKMIAADNGPGGERRQHGIHFVIRKNKKSGEGGYGEQ